MEEETQGGDNLLTIAPLSDVEPNRGINQHSKHRRMLEKAPAELWENVDGVAACWVMSTVTSARPSFHPVRRRPTHRGAGVVHGVQVERATVRTTWTPWAASARLCLGRRRTGRKHSTRATTDPQPGTAPSPSRCRPIPRRRHRSDRGRSHAALDSLPSAAAMRAARAPAGLARGGDMSAGPAGGRAARGERSEPP